jgi:hypothetical protein
MDRRQFLKLSLASSVALASTSAVVGLTGCSESAPLADSGWLVLRESDRSLFSALMPVMLKGAFPTDADAKAKATQACLQYLDKAIYGLGSANAKQLTDLFNLLNFTPTRGMLAGVWRSWENASEEDIDNFLHRWRNSSLGLLNLGYNGLNKLVCAVWFGQPQAWPQVGYPGAPAYVKA